MKKLISYIDSKMLIPEIVPQPKPSVDTAKLAALFEKYGFLKSVAGDALFTNALETFKLAFEEGRGIILSGPTGIGKSCLADAIVRILKNIEVIRLNKPTAREKLNPAWWDYCGLNPYENNLLIDDLGCEHAEDYTHIEPAGEFIVDWHTSHRPGTKLFITTNLTLKEIDARYSARVSSRLAELCVPLKMLGADKRHWKTTK